ncbi:hypothetical protein BGX31_010038 [Mortierella sp. GBA43]|nr:hypothetical protein BGX31_010038 [Mortierella sp. GBA43]
MKRNTEQSHNNQPSDHGVIPSPSPQQNTNGIRSIQKSNGTTEGVRSNDTAPSSRSGKTLNDHEHHRGQTEGSSSFSTPSRPSTTTGGRTDGSPSPPMTSILGTPIGGQTEGPTRSSTTPISGTTAGGPPSPPSSNSVRRLLERALTEGIFQQSDAFKRTVFTQSNVEFIEQRMAQERINMQERSLEMDRQTYKGMESILTSLQALIAQAYELHESPISRLFIVLPTGTIVPGSLAAHQFKLYFLCECGTHTKPKNCPTEHTIHLIDSEGYDITRPAEFFKKYGSYILALMYMFKTGIAASGVVIRPAARLRTNAGLDSTDIGSLVDESIAFLEDLVHKDYKEPRRTEDPLLLTRMKILEGTDIQQLGSYLRIKGDRCLLRSLYRMVASTGHVKWVCKPHLDAYNQGQSVLERFRTLEVDEHLGEIQIKLDSSRLSKEFCNALAEVPGVHKLTVGLSWEARSKHLKMFATALVKTNIVDLTIEGSSLIGKSRDVFHRFDRFDPLWQLGSKGKLQSLRFVGFSKLFYRLSTNAFKPAPKLRVLKIHSPIIVEDKFWDGKFNTDILERCTGIVDLGIRLQNQGSTVTAIEKVLAKVRTLKNLELYYGELCTVATVDQGRLRAISLYLPFSEALALEDKDYWKRRRPLDESVVEEQVLKVLEKHPDLPEIRIGYREANISDIIGKIVDARQKHTNCNTPTEPLRVIFTRLPPPPPQEADVKPAVNAENAEIAEIAVDFTAKGGYSLDLSRIGSNSIGTFCKDLFSTYKWYIQALDMRNEGVNDEVIALLSGVTAGNGSMLKSLTLDPSKFSQERLTQFISSHKGGLTRLVLETRGSEQETSWLRRVLPSRRDLPKLVDLQVKMVQHSPGTDGTHQEPTHVPGFVPWISTMVSAPVPETGAIPSLRKLCLQVDGLILSERRSVINAIDFSALEELEWKDTNSFVLGLFDTLVDCVCEQQGVAPLQILELPSSYLGNMESTEFRSTLDRLREKAPNVMIKDVSEM